MRIVGFCTVGFHVRYIQATTTALATAQATGKMVEGVCDSCRREQEELAAKQRERST